MRFDASHAAHALVTAWRETRQRAVRSCGIPIVTLPEPGRPSPVRVTGWESWNDTVTAVRIEYGGSPPGGPWATVVTARWAGTQMSSVPLRSDVEHRLRQVGQRFSAVTWAEGEATVVVDGRPVAGREVRAGDRWWAVRCDVGDVEITVVGQDWRPDPVAVETVTDLDALLSQPDPEQPLASPEPEPDVPPEAAGRDPLRALVDIHLRHSAAHAAWLADGGPHPEFPPGTSTLWRAAAHRHSSLTDEPYPRSDRAVSSLVSHLCDLQYQASWFRDDPRLRERAISETLLFATGLSDRVSSHRAQRAWEYRHTGPPPGRPGARGGYGDATARIDADRRWLDAWAAWADAHRATDQDIT